MYPLENRHLTVYLLIAVEIMLYDHCIRFCYVTPFIVHRTFFDERRLRLPFLQNGSSFPFKADNAILSACVFMRMSLRHSLTFPALIQNILRSTF